MTSDTAETMDAAGLSDNPLFLSPGVRQGAIRARTSQPPVHPLIAAALQGVMPPKARDPFLDATFHLIVTEFHGTPYIPEADWSAITAESAVVAHLWQVADSGASVYRCPSSGPREDVSAYFATLYARWMKSEGFSRDEIEKQPFVRDHLTNDEVDAI